MLHIISNSLLFSECCQVANMEDSIVILLEKEKIIYYEKEYKDWDKVKCPIYTLENIPKGKLSRLKLINYQQFVELTIKHTRNCHWR